MITISETFLDNSGVLYEVIISSPLAQAEVIRIRVNAEACPCGPIDIVFNNSSYDKLVETVSKIRRTARDLTLRGQPAVR